GKYHQNQKLKKIFPQNRRVQFVPERNARGAPKQRIPEFRSLDTICRL
ncbi:MAG: hypothetical protein, partial [Olavius algarvensis Gamma 3 endosymbiont]